MLAAYFDKPPTILSLKRDRPKGSHFFDRVKQSSTRSHAQTLNVCDERRVLRS